MADFAYETRWFADVAVEHDVVLRASALPNGHVKLSRGEGLTSITVAPLYAERIDTAVVETVLASCVPTVILLIPPTSHYDWSARKLAEANGSTVHTFTELYMFMRDADPRPCIHRDVRYLRELLAQHWTVESVEMICEASMRIKRRRRLSDVIAAIEYEYEFSEEALVRALERHPDARVVVNANPNGKSSNAALTHAESAEVSIFGLREVMGALNFDGARFRDYGQRGRR
jgi:hypothetical protein